MPTTSSALTSFKTVKFQLSTLSPFLLHTKHNVIQTQGRCPMTQLCTVIPNKSMMANCFEAVSHIGHGLVAYKLL